MLRWPNVQVWKWRAWRSIARFYVRLATIEAELKLRGQKPVPVLLDNSAHWKGVTHEEAWVSTGQTMWGGEIPVATGFAARVPVHSQFNSSAEFQEIKYLVAIAELARRQRLQLVTSVELEGEARRHPPGAASGYTWAALNVFSGIEISRLPGRGYLLPESAQDQSQRLLKGDAQPFQSLLPFFHEKDVLDCWHLHTAHDHGIEYFLTLDTKFHRKFHQASKRKGFPALTSRPVLPSELAAILKLREIPTSYVSYMDSDRLFFVRPDLHLPQDRRPTRGEFRRDKE